MSTPADRSGRANFAEFSTELKSVDYDEQDVDGLEDHAEFYHWEQFVEFRFHELNLFVGCDVNAKTLYATNEVDACRYSSDSLLDRIFDISFVVCGIALGFYMLFIL